MAHILIGKDDRCSCGCESKCIIGKVGSALRCHRSEIEAQGYDIIKVVRNFFGRYKVVDKKRMKNCYNV